jgi:metallo-beta-lactamase family protein
VYVDSPLAVKLTEVFRLHPECYDEPARALLRGQDSPFEFEGLRYVTDVEESMRIDQEDRPAIIISASGMCEGGRVLHHLRATIEESRNTVAIVGYQAPYTLGRRLVEGRPEVRIFGVAHPRRAEVVVMDGFSAHADRDGLVAFAEDVRAKGPLRRVVLVHGEPRAQSALEDELTARGFPTIESPAAAARLRL